MTRKLTKTAIATVLAVLLAAPAFADVKIGVIYDNTGPLAGGGSNDGAIANRIAIEMVNERGGIAGHKIIPIYADAQSKTEVAINEAERLLNEAKVDLIMGLFSSAQCVPLAARVDAAKKFMWPTICISSAVFKDRNLKYVFRAQVHSDQFGESSCQFVAEYGRDKLKKELKDIRVAIIHEDGPYGTGVASANESKCKELGLNIVHKEGYAATSTDLSALVTKLRRAQPDVILHTGYNPDITLFLRQAKDGGLKWSALVGHGAGHGQIDKLAATFGNDVDLMFNVGPADSELMDPKALQPGVGDLIAEFVKRYKAQTGAKHVPHDASTAFNQAWIFLNHVLPNAIKNHGGFDAEALRKAALELDIPLGGTIQGYGVKFFPSGHRLAGQNERSFPVVMQHVNHQNKIVWPSKLRTADPVLPLPKGHGFAR